MTALPDYDSPLLLKAFLDSRGMAMQKKFGQNFLVDTRVVTGIIQAINPDRDDCLVEIGPGLGALTRPLLGSVSHGVLHHAMCPVAIVRNQGIFPAPEELLSPFAKARRCLKLLAEPAS